MLPNSTQLPESCKGYHRPLLTCSIYFVHYVYTQILHYFRSVLNCASMKADILHFQTCLELLTSLELQDSCCRKPASCSQCFLSLHRDAFIFLS
ncbi:hypothetical protein T07_8191 [Trichinella nelsoni]|uniref:Uncharacterized protein n=1 Tax=Trichinella nelsoni TaxID=6336 RepID=A0A0V0RGW2_9BILA|nr:hypothetical protein T07_8191 [Trichinella nelsoni]